jgi:hypothetical protein
MASSSNRRDVIAAPDAVAATGGVDIKQDQAQGAADAADLILFNGKITTLDRQNPSADALAKARRISRAERSSAGWSPVRRFGGYQRRASRRAAKVCLRVCLRMRQRVQCPWPHTCVGIKRACGRPLILGRVGLLLLGGAT